MLSTLNLHTVITQTPDPKTIMSQEELNKASIQAKETPCHEIFKRLFLGNSSAFLQATELPYFEHGKDESGHETYFPRPPEVNPHCFDIIITTGQLEGVMIKYYDAVPEKGKRQQYKYVQQDRIKKLHFIKEGTYEKIKNTFEKNHISWHYVGANFSDETEPSKQDVQWHNFIHDCTLNDSSQAKVNFVSIQQMTDTDLEKFQNDKKQAVSKIDPQKWFEPIFQEIDKAVFGEKKVLVHCQAGQSRSPTLLAAYLINRLKVNAEEAVTYLHSNRLCVDPKYKKQLEDYAQKVNNQEKNPVNT